MRYRSFVFLTPFGDSISELARNNQGFVTRSRLRNSVNSVCVRACVFFFFAKNGCIFLTVCNPSFFFSRYSQNRRVLRSNIFFVTNSRREQAQICIAIRRSGQQSVFEMHKSGPNTGTFVERRIRFCTFRKYARK